MGSCAVLGCDSCTVVCQHSSCGANCSSEVGPTFNEQVLQRARKSGAVTDKRTAAMISNGCQPCSLMDGGVVTVTDILGTSVSKTVTSKQT